MPLQVLAISISRTDDLAIRESAASEALKHTYVHVNSVSDAALALRQHAFHVILWDSSYGTISFAQELVSSAARLPILMLYDSSDVAISARLLNSGIAEALIKDEQLAYHYMIPLLLERLLQRHHTDLIRHTVEFERNLTAAVYLDKSGIVTDCNQSFVDILRYVSKSNILGTNWAGFSHIRFQDLLDRLRESNPVVGQEIEFRGSGGEVRIGVANIGRLDDHNSDDFEIRLNFIDITEWRNAEQELKLLKHAIEACTVGITVVDARQQDMPVMYVNPAFEHMTGYSRDEVLAKNPRFLHLNDVDQPDLQILREALITGKSCDVVLRNYRKDGSSLWNSLRVSPVFADNGEITNYVGIQSDITAWREAQEELARSQEKFSRIFHESPDSIALIRLRDERCIEVNEHFRLLTGVDHSSAIRKTLLEFNLSAIHQMIQNLRDGQPMRNVPLTLSHVATAETRHTSVSASVLRLGDEDYALVIVRDVTEQRMIQESLKQSEERYRAIVENQIELVGRATPDGSLTFANEAFCQYLHMTRDQMIGYRFSEHVYPEDAGYVGAAFGSLSSDNPSVMIEHRFVMPDGQVRWHQWTNLALFDADGNLLEIQGVGRDITERKQLEDKVRASQELYRSLIESSDHMVLTVDHQGIIQFASELTASLLDLPVEQVVGQAFGAVFPSDYATEQLERIHEVIQRGSGIAFESPTYSADQWYRTSIQPVRDAAGVTVAALLNITDITEFKRTEVALRASEAKLAEAQRVVLLGYWDWDTERDAVYISDEVCVIFGVDVQTVPVPRHNLLQSVHPDDQSALLDALQRARSGKSFQIDLRIVRSDAVQRYVHVRTSNASVSSSSPAHVFGTIQDISERKQLENELKLLNTELEQRVSERTREVKRQASAMDSTRAGMSLLIDGRFIYMNTALADMYGYSIAQLIGESWTRLFHPDEVLMLQQRVLPLLVQEGAWTGEVLGKRRDDTSFDAEVTLQYSSSGELIFTCNDISLRKQMERQLRSSEARYRVLLEQAPVALLVNDYNPDTRTYRIVYANPAAVNLLGAAGSQDLIGHSAYEFMSESSRELSLNRIHQYLGETNPGPAEYEYYRIDTGELIYMQVASILIEYSDQSAFLSVLVDITDRRRFETELRKSEERYRAILETQKELICRFTPDTTLTYVNPAYCDYFGKTEEQLIGQSWLNLLPVSSRDSVNSTVNALIDKGGSITYEHQVMRDDGKIYWQQWTDQLLDNPTNGAIEIQSVGVDITELKQIQTHLEAALAKERELSELKSRFVSMTSHEFRTPLASIRATSETLRDFYERMSETDRQKRFERINSQIEHMAAMLDDILLIGRLEEGQIQANFEHLRFSDYLRSMLEEFRSIRLNHQLVFHCEANDLQVYADRKLVRQIFTNLLTNASQYSAPDSRIEIRMVQDGGEVVLQVIDEGIGIPDADQKHLFTAFHRAENVGNIKGTGLGLAIAKRAVELHRGSISFKSKVGVGTTFTVRFPIEQTPEMQYQRGQ